jgi:hypothetical protein
VAHRLHSPMAMPLALARSLPNAAISVTEPPPIRETDLDRILKLIPTEILAFYTAAVPIAPQVPWRLFPFVLFLLGLLLVPVVLFLDGRNTNQPAYWPQYVIRTLAFVAWANAISWPFSAWMDGADLNWLRSLAVLIVPLLGALFVRIGQPTTPSP